MKRPIVTLALSSLLLVASRSDAQQAVYVAVAPPPPTYVARPPSNGLGLLITGAVFTGIGAVNLITAPLCTTSVFDSSTQSLCLDLSLGIGVTFAVIGIPMLVVGAVRHNHYVEWRRSGGVVASLPDLRFAPTPGGGTLTWKASF